LPEVLQKPESESINKRAGGSEFTLKLFGASSISMSGSMNVGRIANATFE